MNLTGRYNFTFHSSADFSANKDAATGHSPAAIFSFQKAGVTNILKESAIILVIFFIYFLAGKLGLKVAYENASATAIWAPTGIALTVFLLRGYHVFPAILAGAFLINLTTTGNIPTSILIAFGNTGEGLLGAYLVNKYANGKYVFENTSDIFKFVFYAGILSTAVSATVGVTSLALWGYAKWNSYVTVWLTWWIGDAVGAFLLTPFLVQWFYKKPADLAKNKTVEAAAAILTLAAVSIIEFTPFSVAAIKNYPVSFILIPPFVWIAFRFDKRFVSTAAFIMCAVAVWGTLNGYGPFVVPSQNESLIFLQAFISVISIMSLVYASVIAEQKSSENRLRESEKLRQRVLEESYILMEEKVIERTYELNKAQEELINSEKLASLGRFSAGIAHEIRNPLANISSLAQLLIRKNKDPEVEKHLEFIRANSDIANNIIKDLLNIASPHNINFININISTVINNVCNYAMARCEKSKVRVIKIIQKDIPPVKVNVGKIETAFLNLISNAIEAMPEGGELKITAETDTAQGEAVISFEDTGIGISEENMDIVLEPFFTTKNEGTGLGLSMVYHVIKAHSGKIAIESTKKRGTKLIIRLPIKNN